MCLTAANSGLGN